MSVAQFIDQIIQYITRFSPTNRMGSRLRYRYYKNKLKVCKNEFISGFGLFIDRPGNVTITRGTIIGKGSVIGANSVVTHDIPDYSVAAGNPARVIGSRYKPEEDTYSPKTLVEEHGAAIGP